MRFFCAFLRFFWVLKVRPQRGFSKNRWKMVQKWLKIWRNFDEKMITNFRRTILCTPKYFSEFPEIFPEIFRKVKQKPPGFNRISRKPGGAPRKLDDHHEGKFNKNYVYPFQNLLELYEFYPPQKFFVPVYSENTTSCVTWNCGILSELTSTFFGNSRKFRGALHTLSEKHRFLFFWKLYYFFL